MVEPKDCPECGEVNQPYASFCAKCSHSFVDSFVSSAAPLLNEQPSAEPQGEQASAEALAVRPARRFKKRYLVYGVAVLLFLGLVASVLASPPSNTSTQTAASATPVQQAVDAMVTPVAQESTPTPQPTASSFDSATQIALLRSYLISQGYTITSDLRPGKTAEGYPMYYGAVLKNGYQFATTFIKVDSRPDAMGKFSERVSNMQQLGFFGSYKSATNWQGTSYKGTTLNASVTLSDNNWITVMFGQ